MTFVLVVTILAVIFSMGVKSFGRSCCRGAKRTINFFRKKDQ